MFVFLDIGMAAGLWSPTQTSFVATQCPQRGKEDFPDEASSSTALGIASFTVGLVTVVATVATMMFSR